MKWWRDYATECAAWDAVQEPRNPSLVRALTEDGIEIRVHLWTTQPMYYGTFTIDAVNP